MRLAIVVVLAGCDAVLGLQKSVPADVGFAAPHVSCGDMPSALDKDGDGVPDAIDNCPGIPNPTQGDMDGDGVGDVCDPHVDDSAHPDYFVDTTMFATADAGCWINDGNWSIAGGAATTTAHNATLTRPAASLTVATTRPTLEIGFHLLNITATPPSTYGVGIAVDVPNSARTCRAYHDPANGAELTEIPGCCSTQDPSDNLIGGQHRLVFTRDFASGMTCTVDLGAATTQSAEAPSAVPGPPTFSIIGDGGTVVIDYITIYGYDG